MAHLLQSAHRIFRQKDFAVLLAASFVLGLAYSFVIPFMSIFGMKEAQMPPMWFGVFMTVTSLAAVFSSTILSRWSDVSMSRKSVLLIGGSCGTLGYGGYAFLRDFGSLVLVGAIFLGTAAVCFGQIFALARDLLNRSDVPQSDIPLYMNVFRLFFALAWTVGPALAAWVMASYSFRGTFLAASGLFALFSFTVAVFVPRLPPSPEAHEAARAVPLSRVFQVPGLTAHLVGFTLYFVCSTMGMMNLPLLILDSLGGSETEVGWAYSVAPVFEIPLMFALGLVATRRDHSWIIRIGILVAAAYYGALAFVEAPFQVYPLQVLSAFVVAVMSGVAITFFQNFLPHQTGSSTNLYATASRIGSTLGYLLFGIVAQHLGQRGIFLLCSALTLVSFCVLYLARPARRLAPS